MAVNAMNPQQIAGASVLVSQEGVLWGACIGSVPKEESPFNASVIQSFAGGLLCQFCLLCQFSNSESNSERSSPAGSIVR
jgi:hypothetical protein